MPDASGHVWTDATPERDGGGRAAADGSYTDASPADASAEAAVDADLADASENAKPDATRPGTRPTRPGGVVNSTIVVGPGEVFDGAGERYFAGPAVGDGSQSEGQKPVFRLEDGAILRNIVLGAPAADGIHCYGDVVLENIVWEDVGEDAMTIKDEGTVELRGGSATLADDKVFQINAPSTFRVSDFTATHGGKFIRQNGGKTFRVDVYIDDCDIAHMDEAIFRTDSSVSTVTMTNTRYSNIGDELFMGVSPQNVTTSGNVAY